jgi:hypothetical protein
MVKSGTHACAGCGCNVPQKVGRPGRVRKWCPDCDPGGRYTKADAVACKSCGATVQQESGRGRRLKYCSDKCRRAEENRAGGSHDCVCDTCGKQFRGDKKRRFCSERCRWPFRLGDRGECQHCGADFAKKKKQQRFCCFECNTADAAKTPRGPAAKIYTCMNCDEPFCRKRFPSGDVSCGTKYCSRECAFEARRLKKKCAERPLEVASKLATWFLSWGDDQWPVTSVCQPCGRPFVSQRNAESPAHVACGCCRAAAQRSSMKKHKQCPDCGGELKKGRWLCEPCAATRGKENKRKNRRAHRKRHGQATTFRKRCRKYGAPYTSVCKEAVMSRGKWKCQLCGVKLLRSFTTIVGTRTPHPRSPTIDHIVPLSFGPSSPGHVLDNCQAACWQCNCQRGVEDADSFARRKTTQ